MNIDKLFDSVIKSEDLVGGIYEIVIKLKNREFTFYGISQEDSELNVKQFLSDILVDDELIERYIKGEN
jgi:hypothetical protein